MRALLVNYNYDPTWLKDYPELDVTIWDRSDDGVERNLPKYGEVYRTQNVGDVDYDKLSWLVENYQNLPEVFLWGKTNLFKYVDEDYFKKVLRGAPKGLGEPQKALPGFTPLLKFDHRTYSDSLGPVCRYTGNMYEERNDSWYFNNPELSVKHFFSWKEWAHSLLLPSPAFLPFAPGGNYVLTRERVWRYSVDFYEEMRSYLPYAKHPVEAHACERSYYLLWK